MRVLPVPCLSDNYAYLVHAEASRDAFVVDPSESAPVVAALDAAGLRLVAIVCTHHHPDHVGGNEELLARFGALPVFAYESDEGRVPGQTERVAAGQTIRAAGVELRALHVPGHTLGAVAYHAETAVFTGDTLFVAGCGRVFEGTPAMMHRSLEALAHLPPETRVYCGHEYTVTNLRFAQHAEPENRAVEAKLAWARAARERGEPTVPSTVREELATNPFLRCGAPGIAARFQGATAAEVFAAVRAAKDSFR